MKLEAGERRSVIVHSIIPAAVHDGALVLRWVPQPRLEPLRLRVDLEAPGWCLGAPATWEGSLDRTLVLRWAMHRG